MMRLPEYKGVPIPESEWKNMVGKLVHLSWANFACVWRLEKIEGRTAHLITPKTGRKRTCDAIDLIYTRSDAEQAA